MTKTPITFDPDPARLQEKINVHNYKLRVAKLKDQTIYFDGKVVAKVSGLFPVAVDMHTRVSANGTLVGNHTSVLLLQDNGHLYAASGEGINLAVQPDVADLFYAHGH